MSGIYVHIPFCKSKCHYCDFFSVIKTEGRDGFASLLLEEIDYRKNYLTDKKVDTVYFGGGTPTLLPPADLVAVLGKLNSEFEISIDAEITVEANPDDLTPGLLTEYRKAGFNRISIGTQSFCDRHLQLMNRRHDSAQAIEAVRMSANCGFNNISLDLIYGIPGMTTGEWLQNLEIACSLPATHISAYHLTVEPGTRFGRLKRAGQFSEISGEQSEGQYQLLINYLDKHAYEQYEISNFARNQLYSRHNTKYWTGESYLGLGPSAHSFNGLGRHWNPSSLSKYTAGVHEKQEPKGELVDKIMHRNEYVMTRLRTSTGIPEAGFKLEFGEAAWPELLDMAGNHIRKGYLKHEDGRLFFDRLAWFRSDGILSDLFIVG